MRSTNISVTKIALTAVLAFLVTQLNIYFAWTSHIGMGRAFYHQSSSIVRLFLVAEVGWFTRPQLGVPAISSYFTNLAYSSKYSFGPRHMLVMKYFIDSEVIAFTLAVFLISLLLFIKRGKVGIAILRALEITSAAILPLGVEIYFFDPRQFNIHASDIQVLAGFGWFTNADVLYLSSTILAMTLLIEIVGHAKARSTKTGVRTDLLSAKQ